MMISAFCVFRVANRHTFGAIFDRDLTSPDRRNRYRRCSATWSSSTWERASRRRARSGPMLIRRAELEGIRRGTIDLAFRRWERPRLRVGTRMRTAVGLVEVVSVDEVESEEIGEAEARRAGAGTRQDLLAQLDRHPERPVFRVGLRFAGPDPRIALRQRRVLTAEESARLIRSLDRLDRASRHGAWTRATLRAIERRPETRAADLARELGRERAVFKRDVRKLKELGLTESLETGYRISARGRSLMASL